MARRQKDDQEAIEAPGKASAARGRSSRTTTASPKRRVATGPRPVTHLKPLAEPDVAQQPPAGPVGPDRVQEQIDRLESGMRVMAQTFKRAFEELASSVERLRSDVALTATPADVERSVAKTATPADVAKGTARAVEQLRPALQRMIQANPAPSSTALRVALHRLAEGVEDIQAIVEESLKEDRLEHVLEPDPASNGSQRNGPDPATIWGEDAAGASDFDRDELFHHRKRGPVRRRLEHSWPGKAYANWKYRRT